MIKNFLWKNKIAIGACVLTIAFGIGYWVLSQGTTTIGEDITAGGRVCDSSNNCLDTVDTTKAFGAWQSGFSMDTTYTAATDGFVLGYCPSATSANAVTPDPTFPRTGCEASLTQGDGFTLPVKQGDSWKIYLTSDGNPTDDITIYWLPLQ